MSDSSSELLKGVTVSRLTVPNDANVYGNVHGGTTLKLLEEAGIIISTKFCNSFLRQDEESPRLFTTLTRIESVDFMQPLKIGEVVELTAEILYTSRKSILVEVVVNAEDIIRAPSLKRTTNRAWLWYVAWDEREEMADVPQMPVLPAPQEKQFRTRYSSLIKGDPTLPTSAISTFLNNDNSTSGSGSGSGGGGGGGSASGSGGIGSVRKCICPSYDSPLEHSPSSSESCLSMMIGQNDVAFGGDMCKGGVFLKVMDECAGIVAAKHCRTNVVTACMDATNFYAKIRKGHLLTIHGKTTFTSSKSMEVEVEVWVDDPFGKPGQKHSKVADAFFTYVSIDAAGRCRDVPQLVLTTPEEEASFEAGRTRYLKRKQNRSKMTMP